MVAHSTVAAVSDRRRRSEIDATICVPPYKNRNKRGNRGPVQSTAIISTEDRLAAGCCPTNYSPLYYRQENLSIKFEDCGSCGHFGRPACVGSAAMAVTPSSRRRSGAAKPALSKAKGWRRYVLGTSRERLARVAARGLCTASRVKVCCLRWSEAKWATSARSTCRCGAHHGASGAD
jgi:hypothetical protein